MILVIAEKPSVAQTIAAVLGAKEKKDGFLTGSGYIVSWCVGHLVGLAEAATYGEQYKKWSYDSLPILPQEWKYTVASDKEKQFKTLKELMHRADISEVVNACDAGREGELIFRFVYEMAGCKKPMRRLWISSMEDSAIKEGFSRLKNGEEYDALFASALCRAKADWLIGINATRLFSVLYNHTLNVGRVQTPTLSRVINSLEDDEDLPDADLQQLNTLEAFDYTVNDYFLPVTAGDIFTNSKDEWFVLIGQDCDMARSITRTPKNALAELLPAKVRPQTDFEKWTNDLRSASIYSFRKNLDAGCEVLQVEYQKREYIANEILNLCSFNSTGECKISLSDSIGQEQLMLMPDYMVEYYSKLQQFFLATKTLRIQAEDAFEIVLSKEHSPRLLSFKDFDKTSDTVSFDLKRVCRLTHDYVFYLYKLYLEYRGRQPFQTINLIRQEDTSLPIMYNKEKTGQYLSFRSIPIPDKSNRKNWCWVIDAAELNRVLMLLKLPTLRDGNDDIVLKNECVILQLQQDKQIQIVKAKEKVHFKSN